MVIIENEIVTTSKSPANAALPPKDADMSNTTKEGLIEKTDGSSS